MPLCITAHPLYTRATYEFRCVYFLNDNATERWADLRVQARNPGVLADDRVCRQPFLGVRQVLRRFLRLPLPVLPLLLLLLLLARATNILAAAVGRGGREQGSVGEDRVRGVDDAADPDQLADAVVPNLGSGRIIVSEIETPNFLVNLV